MLSELPFGALLEYAPRGETDPSKRSKKVVANFKAGRNFDPIIKYLWVVQDEFEGYFGRGVILVPTPRSSPLAPEAFWPARDLCQLMVESGLALATLPLIERANAVPKSAVSKDRPNVQQHYDSMLVRPKFLPAEDIVLVDDVVTTGSTLIAAASRLGESYPGVFIAAFAFVRTKSPGEIETMKNPCVGTITRNGTHCFRRP